MGKEVNRRSMCKWKVEKVIYAVGEKKESIDDQFYFFKQKTAYDSRLSLVGSGMCIRDSCTAPLTASHPTRPARHQSLKHI